VDNSSSLLASATLDGDSAGALQYNVGSIVVLARPLRLNSNVEQSTTTDALGLGRKLTVGG